MYNQWQELKNELLRTAGNSRSILESRNPAMKYTIGDKRIDIRLDIEWLNYLYVEFKRIIQLRDSYRVKQIGKKFKNHTAGMYVMQYCAGVCDCFWVFCHYLFFSYMYVYVNIFLFMFVYVCVHILKKLNDTLIPSHISTILVTRGSATASADKFFKNIRLFRRRLYSYILRRWSRDIWSLWTARNEIYKRNWYWKKMTAELHLSLFKKF